MRKLIKNSFIICYLAALAVPFQLKSQGLNNEELLSFDNFKTVLTSYHPVIQQANLLADNAKQEIRIARGEFDPKLGFYQSQKTFTGKDYYNYQNVSLSIPTWLGIDVSAGYENNGGQFTNEELTLGQSYYAGASVSLTKGIYMNERRAALEQAKLLRDVNEQQRQKILNDLYFEAYQSYFVWLNQYLKFRTFSDIYALNKSRYEFVKNSWRLGDAPAIDTTEALSQLQQFNLFRNESYIQWIEEGIKLSKHVWDSTMYTKIVTGVFIPDSASIARFALADSSQAFWLSQAYTHPTLLLNDLKQANLRIKQKLYMQELLPDVSVSAFKLQSNLGDLFAVDGTDDNNRFGLSLGVPLRLSKGRGYYKLTKNQLMGIGFERDFAQRQIENQVLYQLNEISITKSQLSLYENLLSNIRRLYEAENTKYQLGSSTIFLINSRENKLLDVRLKRLDNAIKYQLAILKLYKEVAKVPEL